MLDFIDATVGENRKEEKRIRREKRKRKRKKGDKEKRGKENGKWKRAGYKRWCVPTEVMCRHVSKISKVECQVES